MHKIIYLIVLLVIGSFHCPKLYGSELSLAVGNLCEYVGAIQTNESGDKNFCSFNPLLSSALRYKLDETWSISPQIGATIPKSGRDKNITRFNFFGLLNLSYQPESLELFTGLGLYFTRISGPGGEAELNNGTGTDSFPLPKEAVYSRNFIVNLGTGLKLSETISARVYTHLFNLLSKEDRAFSIGFDVSMNMGDVL